MTVTIITGDCHEIMAEQGPFDLIIADPPYGDTSLAWDKKVQGWLETAYARLKPTGSMWVFGSMRFFMAEGLRIEAAGFRYAQDLVWEKHNGSGFHADRAKRVHEHVVQFYRRNAAWSEVYNDVQMTADATAHTMRRKKRPPHMGDIGAAHYISEDGGPRLMRSVVYMRSCHGRAIHPTEKPADLMAILIRTSAPLQGLVGDFFAGSGSAGEACKMEDRRYIGCEIDPDMAQAARDRVNGILPLVRSAAE